METKQSNGLGTAGMVIGIIALITSCIVIGGFLGIVGLILSIIAITQKNKKTGTAIAGIVLNAIAIIIMILMFLGSSSNDDKVENVTPVEQQQNNTEIANIESDTDNNTINNDALQFEVGEIAEYKDVQISILNYEESTGNDWGEPADGKVFIFPEIEIVNNSDEEISISSMLSFECYCDDYKMDFSSSALMAISADDNMQQLDGTIAPGKKLKGVLGIEVPSDWSTIEIYYKDNVWLDSDFSFIINK